uniref:C3H1-type domain-containing protein n=1 Tax=Oryza rufipogon TaxID=4529 RepID=A0A0E0NGE6_ORYRU
MSTAAADPAAAADAAVTRKERRRERKKERRRRARREAAEAARKAAEALAADPEEERRLRELEEAEADASERARRAFEDAERRWLEAAAARAAEKAAAAREESTAPEDSSREYKDDHGNGTEEDDEWEYVEDGPAEIIWEGNEITVKKKMVKVPKKAKENQPIQQEDRPTSNPLPPQSVAFASQRMEPSLSAQEVLEKDKAHCPFHLKTGACRFGVRCSRVHFYPDKSCTLLMRNMYSGPGLALEQDEGLECTDEEIEQSYEEFYEDVHTEFLKFGELVNFKVCRNGSLHLRGNVYVHYKSLDSALIAYSSMNGRYFAGKQITCEFVAVTRWKVAICGEYMRSRFKTCSRGIACNFIHCFRNPGGDYEWADWDNPPPRYWIRKMAALFGPSDDSIYGKPSDTPHLERSQSSDRRRPRSSDPRYTPSRTRDEDAHKQHSSRDYSHSKHERSSHTEHRRDRKESSASDKHRHREIKDKTSKYSSNMESERESHKYMREEKHRIDHGNGGKGDHGKVRSRKNRSERQESLEPGSSGRSSDFIDQDTTESPSGSKSTGRHHKKTRRQSLEEHSTRRSSRHRDMEDDGRGQSVAVKRKDHHDTSDDRWVATNSDVDSDLETQYQRSSSEGSKLGMKYHARSDSETGYGRSRSGTTKSRRERKRQSGNGERSDTLEVTSDSDTRDMSSDAWRSRSRSSDENLSTHRSRRKRSRSSHDS